jgi:hypothetical protein
MQVTATAVSSPQRTRGIKNNVPSKLGNLPLLRDVVVLPGLVYYLRNRMCRGAAIAARLHCCKRDRICQTILQDKSNEGRGNVGKIDNRSEHDNYDDDQGSSIHPHRNPGLPFIWLL